MDRLENLEQYKRFLNRGLERQRILNDTKLVKRIKISKEVMSWILKNGSV